MPLLLDSLISETDSDSPPVPNSHVNISSDSGNIGTTNYDSTKELRNESAENNTWNLLTIPTKTIVTIIKFSKNTRFPNKIFKTVKTSAKPSSSGGKMDLPLENITINSRPVIQATERWVAYSLMTFNLSLILTLTLERCLAIQFPFWTMAILTSSHATYTLLSLVGGTLTLHTPQFVREVVLAINEPTSLKDGFQGKMTQVYFVLQQLMQLTRMFLDYVLK